MSELTATKLIQIAENSTKLFESGKNEVFRNFPESLKGSAEGTICALTGISPIEHTMEVKLRNKNLIPYPYDYTQYSPITSNGITYTDNGDGTITANGTATGTSFFVIQSKNTIPVGTYYFHCAPKELANQEGRCYVYFRDPDNQSIWDGDYGYGLQVKLNTATRIDIAIATYEGAVLNNLVFKPQLEIGTAATAYAPYVADFSSTKLIKRGKNLIPYPYVNTTKTSSGITYTDNGDGSIHVKGTATGDAWFMLCNTIDFGTETMNAILSNSATNGTYAISKGLYYGASNKHLSLNFSKGTVVDEIFYPQLEVGTVATAYEPYIAPIEYQAEADGTVKGVTSIYPVTTLSAEGAVASCNYIKDVGQIAIPLVERSATHYDIPAGTKAIGMHAFYNFQTLKTITIPKGVTSIGGGAFNSCSYLQSFKAPEGITDIGSGAFAWCSRCKVFDFSDNKTVPTLGTDGFTGSFNGTNADAQLIVPYALYSSWSSANNWKDWRANMVTKGKAETGADVNIDMIWIDGQNSWKSENFNENPDASVSAYCKKDGAEIGLNDESYFTNLRFETCLDGSYLDYHFTTNEWDTPVVFYKAGLYEFGVLNEDGKVTYRAYVEVTGDTPTFTFVYPYIAEYGMTFGEWVNSKYNNGGFYISGNGVWQTEYTQITEVTENDYGYNDYRGVTVDEVIKPNAYYIVS